MVKSPSNRSARKAGRMPAATASRAVASPAPAAAAAAPAAPAAPPETQPAAAAEPTRRPAMNDQGPGERAPITAVDIETFAKNAARLIEEGGKAMAAYLKPREEGQVKSDLPDEVADVVKTLGQVLEYW